MQDRLETYTVPLYDLQEEVIGEFEIGCAMDVTGYSLEAVSYTHLDVYKRQGKPWHRAALSKRGLYLPKR